MKTTMKGLFAAAVLMTLAVAAQAALCGRCREMMFTADIGQCKECDANTSSGGFKLCPACSQKLGQCQACRTPLNQPGAPVAPPRDRVRPMPPRPRPAPAPGEQPAAKPDELPQGVTGRVIKMTGDFMPSIGPGPKRGNLKPLAVPVHVFKGKVKPLAKPDPKHARLVKVVQAGPEGVYRADLPPGEYTVVAEIDGALYLNSFDGDGNWSSLNVEANQWTKWDIKDSSEAVF